MKLLKLLSFSICLISAQVIAEDPWCAVDANKPIQRIQLDVEPSYFISADPSGRYVGVISRGNHVYDLEASQQGQKVVHSKVTGSYDPVFTPDGKYLTLPGGEFYDADEIRKGVQNKQEIIQSSHIGKGKGSESAYQSVGLLKDRKKTSVYMYVSDSKDKDASAQLEYFIAEVDHKKKELKTLKQGSLCKSLDEAHTPMISADGEYLSVLNPKTKSTQIYRVGENGEDCKLMVDLGVPTGKVSFDFGKAQRKLAFHVDRHSTNVSWFSGLGMGVIKDTYVMDLEVTGKGDSEKWVVKGLERLNVHKDEATGTYYPRFRKDGTIVAVSVEKEPREINGKLRTDTNYYLDVYDPKKGKINKNYDPDLMNSFLCEDQKLKAGAAEAVALAWLWKKVCNESSFADRIKDALLITPYLNKNACYQLVDKFWNEKKTEFLQTEQYIDKYTKDGDTYGASIELLGSTQALLKKPEMTFTADDLKKACPNDEFVAAQSELKVRQTASVVETSPETLFINKCGGCHDTQHPTGGFAFQNGHSINKKNSSSYTGLNAKSAAAALQSLWDSDKLDKLRMPPAGSEQLKLEDKKKISQYLMDFLSTEEKQKAQEMIQRESQNVSP